jgi:hypothetical protein
LGPQFAELCRPAAFARYDSLVIDFDRDLAFTGAPLIQQRQNLSTKFRVLGWLGLAGILIEGTESVYLFSNSSDAITSRTTASTVAFKLVERTVPYSVVFAATVLVGYGIGRSQTSTATPPPRFGRK